MDIRDQIINYVRKNRVSTTEVADALGKTGVINGLQPINTGMHKVGSVKCIFTAHDSNYEVHEQIRDLEPDKVALILPHKCEGRAIIGDLIAKFMLLYRECSAVVVDGMVRDVAALRREGFSIWSSGYSPLGCFNKKADPTPDDVIKEKKSMYEDGIAVCDDAGVVVIPPERVTEETLGRLERIEMQEDIWFFCLDTLKWDTKKIVCDKAYLNDTQLLSSVHLDRLAELNKPLDKRN